MCNQFCLSFVNDNIPSEVITDCRILEVGAYNINGTCRHDITKRNPALYLGVDLELGPNVDIIASAYELEYTFGSEYFHVVINTEMLEHVTDWREAINNMKSVIKIGGYIAITTRSVGFIYHPYPCDWWRFSLQDMIVIFIDYRIIALQGDPSYECPGVGIVAQKIQNKRQDISKYHVHMMEQPADQPQTPPPIPCTTHTCKVDTR